MEANQNLQGDRRWAFLRFLYIMNRINLSQMCVCLCRQQFEQKSECVCVCGGARRGRQRLIDVPVVITRHQFPFN